MIHFAQGNLLDSTAEALVNTVNTVGISGKGLALMFKEAFPDNFRAYAAACKSGLLAPGELFIFEQPIMVGPRFIVNFATKQHWRNPSKLSWIANGLARLRQEVQRRGIRSIAIPPLGAGHGGLHWSDVKPLIVAAMGDLDCDVGIFEPTDIYHNAVKRQGVQNLTPARALMAEMIRQYEILGFDCSILEAQKLAWFLSGAIDSARLPNPIADDFVANRYGPYSEKVRHLLDGLDGTYLECHRRLADARHFDPIRFCYERQDEIVAYLTTPEASLYRAALDDANGVIDGYQSPHGLELLATVDWLHKHAGAALEANAMMDAIAHWPGPDGAAERKAKIFTRHHVQQAVQRLLPAMAA